MRYAAKSITGVRPQNQDTVFIPRGGEISLAVVADGMGGHNAGDVASALAVETVVTELKKGGPGGPAALLINAVNKANSAVYEKAVQEDALRGMGTTMVLALLFHSKFYAANVGDSRLYLFHQGTLTQITTDHSYVAELVASGYITKEEAARHPRWNLITRALGTRACERVDVFEKDWEEGDKLLLCSDGLYGELNDEDLIRALGCAGEDMQQACEDLVQEALYAGSRDNISAIMVLNEEAAI